MPERRPRAMVIGVGHVGALIARDLVVSGAFSEVVLAGRSEPRVEGVALSLRVLSEYLSNDVKVTRSGADWMGSADVVVVAIKDDYDPRRLLRKEALPQDIERSVRTVGLRLDVPLLAEVADRLSGFRGKIAVVTNPVEICAVLMKRSVASATVVGLGLSVDAARFAMVARRMGYGSDVRKTWFAGNHFDGPVALRSLWPLPAGSDRPSEAHVAQMLSASRTIGPRIVGGLGFTAYDCASVFADDVRWLAGDSVKFEQLCGSLADLETTSGGPLVRLPAGVVESLRLDGLSASEVGAVAEGRERTRRSVRAILDRGLFGYRDQGDRR